MPSPPQWLWFPLEFTEYLCLYLKDSPSPSKVISVAGEIVVDTWFASRKKVPGFHILSVLLSC